MSNDTAFMERDRTMQVTRIQYPVRQGCFHAGHIHWGNDRPNEPGDFHYIYDCGSNNGSALRDTIDIHRTLTSHIDALFVSYLHDDHVNGIDRLLSAVKVDTVFFPYVDEVVFGRSGAQDVRRTVLAHRSPAAETRR